MEIEIIWKPVRGFEDWAEISNYGQIHKFERVYYCGKNHQSKKIQEEKFTYGNEVGGYLYACIGGVQKGVHQWVYLTFVGNIPEGMEVNHIDEDKHNNRLDNLNLLTHGDNMRYGTGIARSAASRRGRKQSSEHITKKAAALSKPVQALDKVTGEVVYEFPSTMEAGRQGFHSGCIAACCNGKRKTHKGFIWRHKFV